MQYQNAGERRSTGIEFEVRGNPSSWLETSASFVVEKASGDLGQRLPNSPGRIGKAGWAVPLARNKVYFSSALQYLSARMEDGGIMLRPVVLVDATLSTKRLFRGYDLEAGIRNALNWQYDQPNDLGIAHLPANGRTLFVKLIWRYGE
jgi:outer membrane receptor protein involved in Fe transport